jgi:hypothetical protein
MRIRYFLCVNNYSLDDGGKFDVISDKYNVMKIVYGNEQLNGTIIISLFVFLHIESFELKRASYILSSEGT